MPWNNLPCAITAQPWRCWKPRPSVMDELRIFDCAQNSPEWYEVRRGVPTSSNFAKILAKGEGKTRRRYLHDLAAEILTGAREDGFSNEHTERGHVMEDDARNLYAFARDVEPVRV